MSGPAFFFGKECFSQTSSLPSQNLVHAITGPFLANEFRRTQQGYTYPINGAWQHHRTFYEQATLFSL
jgi:hypothetical protein